MATKYNIWTEQTGNETTLLFAKLTIWSRRRHELSRVPIYPIIQEWIWISGPNKSDENQDKHK